MYVFGEIDKSSKIIENNIVNYTQNLTTSSVGINSIKIVSGSISQSYWKSLNVMFYTSGSPIYAGENKFGKPSSNLEALEKYTFELRVTGIFSTSRGYPMSLISTVTFAKNISPNFAQNTFQKLEACKINFDIF